MTLGRQNTLHDFMTGRTARKSFRRQTNHQSPASLRSYSLRRATLAKTISLPSSSILQSNESLNINTLFTEHSLRIRKFSLDLGPSGIPSLILAVEYLKYIYNKRKLEPIKIT